MSGTLKRIISALLCAVMLFGAAPLDGFVGLHFPKLHLPSLSSLFTSVAYAEEGTYPITGTIENGLTWSLSEDGVLSIDGEGEIRDYYSYSLPWHEYRDRIKSIIISDGIVSIGNYVFRELINLKTVTMGSGVKTIRASAFRQCYSIEEITLGQNVETLGGAVFENCYNLHYVNIPKSVKSLATSDFEGCNLYSICVDEANSKYASENGVLYTKDFSTLIRYPIGRKEEYAQINPNVKKISHSAFSAVHSYNTNGEQGPRNIIIPDGVTLIDSWAFSGNCAIESIELPNTVTSLGNYVFSGAQNLSRVVLSNKLYSLPNNTFYNCIGLKSITIPDSISSLGMEAFSHSGIETITFSSSSMLSDIGSSAFEECSSLTSINLPERITNISKSAFQGCTSLTNVSFPLGLTSISADAFKGCSSLDNIALPESLTTIGSHVFEDCASLQRITLPDSLTSLGSYAFKNCSSLIFIIIPNNVTQIGQGLFDYCSSLTGCVLSNSIKEIPNDCFRGCTNLLSIDLPDSITAIRYEAFILCESLTMVRIPESVTTIGYYVFQGCTNLASVVMPKHLIDLGSSVFVGTELYNDPNNRYGDAIYIDDYLIKVLATDLTTCDIRAGTRLIAAGAFSGCKNLIRVNIPDSVVSICGYAFYECRSLEFIEHTCNDRTENGIVGDGAFNGCKSLKAVKLGASITTIGNEVFWQCTQLQCVEFSNRVSELYIRAFSTASNLTDIFYGGTSLQWSKIKLSDHTNDKITSYFKDTTIHFRKSFDFSLMGNFGKNDIIITPKSADLNVSSMEHTKLHYNNKVKELPSAEHFIIGNAEAVSGGASLTRFDYQDYIIPEEVLNSWRKSDLEVEATANSDVPGYKHTAFLKLDRKDDKPYVSTVFGRTGDDGVYSELQTQTLKIFNGDSYSIIISAGNIGTSFATYCIEQDSEHKISNVTGVFTIEDLFGKLVFGKTCYAYVKSQDGVMSELVEIKLEKQAEGMGEKMTDYFSRSTLNLLGDDFVSFQIPSNIPLLGDAKLSLDAFKLPVGFMIDGDSIMISIGANVFNKDKTYGENWTKDYKYSTFKDWKDLTKKTLSESAAENFTTKGRYKKVRQDFLKKRNCNTWIKKGKDWDIDALGYMEVSMVNGEFIVKEAMISVEGSFSFKYTQQGAIWVIPSYAYVEMKANLGVTGGVSRLIASEDIPLEWEAILQVEPSLKVGAGIGVKDIASLGIWAKASVPISFDCIRKHFRMDIVGELGIEAQFCVLKAEKTLVDGTLNVANKYYGVSSKKVRQINPVTGESEEYVITTSVADRDYLGNTSVWLGNRSTTAKKTRTIENNGLQLTSLQTSVFKNAQPKVVSFGDKLLMTWIEDDSSRDTYNRMRLMYSVYDGLTWSAPRPVLDNGYNDNDPQIASDGTNVFFVWQKINKTLMEADCSDIENLAKECEIYVAKYNGITGQIESARQVTNNNCFDYSGTVAILNNAPVYYWMSCTDNNMTNGSANTLYRMANNSIGTVKDGMNYILGVTAAYINGQECVTYVMDADGNTLTTNDINAFTYSNGHVSAFDKGDNDVAYSAAFYGELNGKTTLFVTDTTNIYYSDGGEIKTVFEDDSRIDGSIQIVNYGGVGTIFWTQLTDTGNALYSSSYENGKWTLPIVVSSEDRLLSDVHTVAYGGRLSGVCLATEMTYDEETEEYTVGQTDICSLTINDVADISVDTIMLNERDIIKEEETPFDVYVTNNGSETVNTVVFHITDTLGYDESVEMDVGLTSGEGRFVTLTYTAPSDFRSTTLTVSVACDDITENKLDNNCTSSEIGKPNIVLTESEVHYVDGCYVISAIVTNDSEVDAENVVVKGMLGDEDNVILTIPLNKLAARNTKVIDFTVSEDEVSFDDADYTKFFVSVGADDYESTKVTYIIEHHQTTCLHPFTETEERIEPTCFDEGREAAARCLACGEVVTGGETIPIRAHNYVFLHQIMPTCITTGEKVYRCEYCDELMHEVIPVDPSVHSEQTIRINSKYPTETEDGYTGDVACRDCRSVLNSGSVIPKGTTAWDAGTQDRFYCRRTTRFISDIMIGSSPDGADAAKQILTDAGFTVLNKDLNSYAGGNWIYLGYKVTTDYDDAIKDIRVYSDPEPCDYDSFTLTINGTPCQYLRCGSDLNENAGGDCIYLYYTKNPAANVGINSLRVTTSISGSGTPVGSLLTPSEPAEMNKGTLKHESDVYLYMVRNAADVTDTVNSLDLTVSDAEDTAERYNLFSDQTSDEFGDAYQAAVSFLNEINPTHVATVTNSEIASMNSSLQTAALRLTKAETKDDIILSATLSFDNEANAQLFNTPYATVAIQHNNHSSATRVGTGCTINLTHLSQNYTYTTVMIGDLDGDGWYDGTDAYFVGLVANGMVSKDALTDAQRMAADCNHDDVIDNADVALLEQAGLLLAQVDQTLSVDELITDSVYLEYCSLIDQSIEITEPAPTEVNEPAAEQGSATTVWQIILNLFKRLVNFVTMIFSIIVIPQ